MNLVLLLSLYYCLLYIIVECHSLVIYFLFVFKLQILKPLNLRHWLFQSLEVYKNNNIKILSTRLKDKLYTNATNLRRHD